MRAVLLVAVLLSTTALAQKAEDEAGDTAEVDKDALSPLRDRVRPVSGHLFLMKGRFELSPGASFSVRDPFYSKYVLHLMVAYHFTEELGVRLRGGYAFATPSGTAQICQTDSAGLRSCRIPTVQELTDKGAYGLTPLLVDIDLEWAPIYGKLAFIAEAFVHFNFYINIGANLVLYQNSAGPGTAAVNNVTVGGNVGLGLRWFFTRWLTARLEMRDVLYYESNQQYPPGSFRNQLLLEAGISIFLPTDFEEKIAMGPGKRFVSMLAALVTVSFAAPAYAQMNFEGLDLGGKKKKKDEKKKDDKKKDKKDEKKDEGAALPEGGLDLSKPVDEKPAKGKKEKEGTAAGMNFDAVDVSGKSGNRQRLDVSLNQFKDEKYEDAALSSFELMNDPKMAGLALESEYLLAKSLYRMGLYHSALGEFSKVLARGPNTKFFKSSLEWLFFIGRKTVNEQVVLDEIVKYSNAEFPERFRNEFRYLLARYHLVRGQRLDDADQKGEADKSFEEVKRLALTIPKGDAFYPRAKFLEGVAYFREGKLETALESLKEVVRTTRTPPGVRNAETSIMQSLRELAFMQLARIHYQAKQNRYASYYYSKVERGNAQWLEALFESSWANYRVGQYEQALGNMITLSSPFFRDEYFPEVLILKAVIYFENCRYRETLSILEDFERIYGPVQSQLEEILAKKMEATEYYKLLADIKKKNSDSVEKSKTDEILERVLNLALTDKDLKKTTDSITELEAEIDGLGTRGDNFKFSGLTKALIEGLKGQREALINKGGVMAKGKLEFENSFLKTLRANGLRIRFETTDKEKNFLEDQLAQGGNKEIVKKYKYSVAVSDDQLYWPFVAEYWRDELGTYQYTLTKGCIDRDSGSKQTTESGQ